MEYPKWYEVKNYNGSYSPIKNTDPLPEERKHYLVTYTTPAGKRRGLKVLRCRWSYSSPRVFDFDGSKQLNGKIIAWAELPEPFKG